MRFAFGVEYDGSGFCGWQFQSHSPSVQAAVEAALSRVADHEVRAHAAGRTDTGVHATGQVFHIDTQARRSARAWILGGNAHLPPAVSLLWAEEVPDAFHARFSAVGRTYRYVILNHTARGALLRDRVAWECRPLDLERMRSAAGHLLGRHDFSSFRSFECQAKSPVRTLRRLDVRRRNELILIEVEADGFLHHMVRNLAGVLVAVGTGKAEPDWARSVLAARDRREAGVTAPPEGLYLTQVEYPPAFDLPPCGRESAAFGPLALSLGDTESVPRV